MRRFVLPFLAVTALGLPGILSLIPLTGAAVAAMRALPGAPALPDAGLIALSLVQPLLLLMAGAAIGAALSERLGLVSLTARALRGERLPPRGGRGVLQALLLSTLAAFAVLALDALARWSAPVPGRALIPAYATWSELATALLYGGITEEIIMRYGVMTGLVALGALVLRGTFAKRPQAIVSPAIALSALAFGAGHLPAALMAGPLAPDVVIRVLLLNGLVGLVLGWLYWRRSLEHAMLAHANVHVVFWLVGLLAARLLPS